MSIRNHSAVALLFISAILAGCATSRSEIALSSPAAASTTRAATKARTVVIRSVVDERVFEEAPKVASIPSLGFGGASKASEEVKARAVGRKRGGFGKALGDVLLDDGQTVVGLVRENLTTAFQETGFQVVNEGAADPASLVVDVHIKQFWAWFQPGFWAIALNANIETNLEISGTAPPTAISVHVEDSRQMATETAWLEIVEKALLAYRTEAASKLSAPPF
jgi:uncharacterized lipoprotein YajG